MRTKGAWFSLVTLGTALFMSSCGSDAKPAASSTSAPKSTAAAQQNACPVDGCRVTITDVQKSGTELRITWKTNYTPDFSKNHVHVFWDKYTADQVSNDAAARGEVQGEWVPTDDNPIFVTGDVVSTSKRGTSTKVCVTAGDRDHNVIDSSIVNCRDVADLL
jgi:hypothetical protein